MGLNGKIKIIFCKQYLFLLLFVKKAKIALRFIEALKQVYSNEEEISIYLLDLGLENVAYNEERDKVFFIDAESLLIVDKKQLKQGFIDF